MPDVVFAPRVKVPFVTDLGYYGSGNRVEKGWKELTQGIEPGCGGYAYENHVKANIQTGGDAIWLKNPSEYGLGRGISAPFRKESPVKRSVELYQLHYLVCAHILSTAKGHN